MKKTAIFSLFLALIISGCVSQGSHTITGKARPAFLENAVIVFPEIPPSAEIIGVVSAVATGRTAQKDADIALNHLKREAAKIGANGISEIQIKHSFSDGTTATAKAIFVP